VAVRQLTMGATPDREADLASAIRDLAGGQLEKSAFLSRFGHRGGQEMELAEPRWDECSAGLEQLASNQAPAGAPKDFDLAAAFNKVLAEGSVKTQQMRADFEARVRECVERLRTHIALRETAKHCFMKGYALIRRTLVELDNRYRLEGGIFYL